MGFKLRPMATWITVCDTCKREGWTPEEGTPPPGALFAALVEDAALGSALRTRRHACLMGCDGGCNVAIQAHGKLAYTLGRFEPSAEAAQALVAWASLHADSPSGVVPYKLWPQPVKGHFVTRHPPLPEDA